MKDLDNSTERKLPSSVRVVQKEDKEYLLSTIEAAATAIENIVDSISSLNFISDVDYSKAGVVKLFQFQKISSANSHFCDTQHALALRLSSRANFAFSAIQDLCQDETDKVVMIWSIKLQHLSWSERESQYRLETMGTLRLKRKAEKEIAKIKILLESVSVYSRMASKLRQDGDSMYRTISLASSMGEL